mgnify:CR=1 FL=1
MTNQDNYCVIMGGGIGSRFWPFSRKTLPKQFLDFFGTGRSLLQQTFDRFQKVIPTEIFHRYQCNVCGLSEGTIARSERRTDSAGTRKTKYRSMYSMGRLPHPGTEPER